MSVILYVIIFGVPILTLASFVFLLSKQSRHLAPTENFIALILISSFFILIPFLMSIGDILSAQEGWKAHYLLIISMLKEWYPLSKFAFIILLLYLMAQHIIFFLPFLILFLFISARNKLYRAISNGYLDTTIIDKDSFKELENLIKNIRMDLGITKEVGTRILENAQAHRVIGGSPCAVMKYKDLIYLIFNRNFLEFFSKGSISKDEVRAVLYHEFGHIINRDYYIPILSRVIMNRRFLWLIYFSFCIFLAIVFSVKFFFGVDSYDVSGTSVLMYPIVLFLIFLSFYFIFGVSLLMVAYPFRYCEHLADNFAGGYISKEILKKAIVKLGIVSEAINSAALNFASKAKPIEARRKQTILLLLQRAWGEILKCTCFFIRRAQLCFHPSFSDRIEAIDNPKVIMEESDSGLLNFELFGIIAVYTICTIGLAFVILNKHFRDKTWQYFSPPIFSWIMYYWFVFIASLPLRYKENPFIFGKKNVKLIIIYSISISILVNIILIVGWERYLPEGINSDWLVDIFILWQNLNPLELLLGGFFITIVFFGIFLSVGNLIIKRKMKTAHRV